MTAANTLSSLPHRQFSHTVDVSFIIPVYNEVDNVDALIREVAQTGYRLNRSFEMVLVDDGSKDGTVQALLRWSWRTWS